MKRIVCQMVSVMVLVSLAHAQEPAAPGTAPETAPALDYTTMDPAVLAIMHQQLSQKLAMVQADLERTRAKGAEDDSDDEGGESDEASEADEDAGADVVAAPAAAPAGEIDYASLPQEQLAAMCQATDQQIADAAIEIAQLESGLAEMHGGSVAAIDDDMIVIEDGKWVLKIVSNKAPDLSKSESDLRSENNSYAKTQREAQNKIAVARTKVSSAESALETARTYYDKVHERYTVYRGSGAKVEDNEYRYPKSTRSSASRQKKSAEQAVKSAKRELKTAEKQDDIVLRKHQIKVRQLEEQIREIATYRMIEAQDAQAKPVRVIARGAYFQPGADLREGQWYAVGGRGRFSATDGEVYLKLAETADAPPDAVTTEAEESPATPGTEAAPDASADSSDQTM